MKIVNMVVTIVQTAWKMTSQTHNCITFQSENVVFAQVEIDVRVFTNGYGEWFSISNRKSDVDWVMFCHWGSYEHS